MQAIMFGYYSTDFFYVDTSCRAVDEGGLHKSIENTIREDRLFMHPRIMHDYFQKPCWRLCSLQRSNLLCLDSRNGTVNLYY